MDLSKKLIELVVSGSYHSRMRHLALKYRNLQRNAITSTPSAPTRFVLKSLALLEEFVDRSATMRGAARAGLNSAAAKVSKFFSTPQTRFAKAKKAGLQFESLEPKMVLAANLVISEFMASNSNSLKDEDGDASDWIEIHNADSVAVNLQDWYLSDNSANLSKWAFPSGETIQPGDYLIVFASGKNRAIAGSQLHTNFSLAAGGEYLGLSYDDSVDGLDAVSELDPAPQQEDVSYGFNQTFETDSLLGPAAPVQVLVPSVANGGSTLGNTWTQPGFTPTGWTNGAGGVGWDAGTDFDSLIGTDVQTAMQDNNASAFIRYPFAGVDPANIDDLKLDVNYDDGFIAYLNGTEVARRNAPEDATWNSAATAEHGGIASKVDFNTFTDLSQFTPLSNSAVGTSRPSIVSNRLRLTPSVGSLGNSAFLTAPRQFGADYSFSTSMAIDIHTPSGSGDLDGFGADGMTFVIAAGPPSVGLPGGGLGLDGAFANFVALEFDTYETGSFDPAAGNGTHLGIDVDGASIARTAVGQIPYFNGGTQGQNIRYAWIDYDGITDQMQVYFGNTATKPASPALTATVDLASIFDIDQLTLGFTAGTGGAWNTHDVVNWHFQAGAGDLGATSESIDISQYAHLLSPTGNVLAIHGMNLSAGDNDPNSTTGLDFVVRPEIKATIIDDIATDNPQYFTKSTPGGPNGIGAAAPSQPVNFSAPSGMVTGPFSLTLTAEAGATIYYTTNGAIPTATPSATNFVYSSPINITQTARIRAISVKPGNAPSKVIGGYYTFVDSTFGSTFSSNLPLIFIDTFGGGGTSNADGLNDAVLQPAVMGVIDKQADGRASPLDPLDFFGRIGIRRRGQTSSDQNLIQKPPFTIELWDETNNDDSASLLGMPANGDWVLVGPYSEKAMVQNYMAQKWFQEMGYWSPHAQWVEVFVNGDNDPKFTYYDAANPNSNASDYSGVYLLMEKIEINEDRVDIAELTPTDNALPDISGGYIWKRDKVGAGDVPWTTSHGVDYRLHDPDDGDVTPAQKTWLVNYINEAEGALYGPNFTDPVNGYEKYFDTDSFIDHFIMVEMMKNIDGFRLSTYYYKDRGGKITMAPVWDYNLAFGNADYLEGWQPTEWYHSQCATLGATSATCAGALADTEFIYFRRFLQDPNFKQKLVDRWEELRKTIFSNAQLAADLNEQFSILSDGDPNPQVISTTDVSNGIIAPNPVSRNYTEYRTLGVDSWPNPNFGSQIPGPIFTTFKQWADWTRDSFLIPRANWIDSQFLAAPVANQNGGIVDEGFQATLTAPQTIYYTTDGSDPRAAGGFVPGTPPTVIFAQNGPIKWIVPTSATPNTATWTARTFDEAGWNSSSSGLGYERNPGDATNYTSLIGAGSDTRTLMDGVNGSAYMRVHFNIADPAAITRLLLEFKYDDGFVAYLNGTLVSRRNCAGTPAWNSVADAIHDDGLAIQFEEIDLTTFKNLLVAGDNVLAIQGMNSPATSTDFLMRPEIRINGTPDTTVPAGIAPTATQYTGPITINDNTRVIARSRNNATGDWSGPLDLTYITEVTPIAVTEINYNPADPSPAEIAAGFTDNNDFEFIELRNTSAAPLDLDGVRLSQGVDFEFTSTSLDPGERVLLVKNQAAFELRYGAGHNIAGVYTGSLNNDGEQITVLGPLGEAAMDFTYDDSWYPLTDGGGYSLVIVNDQAPAVSWNDAVSWRVSDFAGGSPDGSDTGIAPAQGAIRINEILLDTAGAGGQRIELYNTTAGAINVSGFYLTDDRGDLTKYRLPIGLPPIAAGGYLVLNGADTFGTPLPLSKNGGELVLHAANAAGTLIGFETNEDFTAAEPEVSQGWYSKPSGGHDFTAQTSNTLGAANSAPKIGPVVINEIMYGPAGTDVEFIELYNISASPVSLQNWSFGAGVTYAFGNVTLNPGQYMVVVPVTPAEFLANHTVPAGAQVVGPFTGSLDNNGEELTLSKPNATSGLVRVDRVNYDDEAPWPTRPDGQGPSLTRISSTAYGNDVSNWASDNPGGSPGGANTIYDETPPSVPAGLTATVVAGPGIQLAWTASTDAQSAVDHYAIYRDGVFLASANTNSYTDTTVGTTVSYSYEVSAVNTSSVESSRSTAAAARVLVVTSADPVGTTQVRVNFNTPLSAATAETAANYTILGIAISSAVLEAGGTSVLLSTAALTNGQPYRVIVNNVTSNASALIQPNSNAVFTPGAGPGLKAEYSEDPATSTNFTDELQNIVLTRVDPDLLRLFATGSYAPGEQVDFFSARWTGKLRSVTAGLYNFTVNSNDGHRVWIWPEGEAQPATPLANAWGANTKLSTFSYTMDADTKNNIKVEWFDNTGTAQFRLIWVVPGQAGVDVPASQFTQPVALETTPPQVAQVMVAGSQWSPAFLAQLPGGQGVNVPIGGTSAPLSYSGVNQVKVRFDSDVNVHSDQLTVNGMNVPSYAIADFSYDVMTFTATWTLTQAIDLDRATIGVAGGVTDLASNAVAGPLTATVRVANGDVNGDGTVSSADRSAMIARQMTNIGHPNYATAYDLNGDGLVNISDIVLLQQHVGQSIPGGAPAAAAAVVTRVNASPEESTAAAPLRVTRRATAPVRQAAAVDNVLGQEVLGQEPAATATSGSHSGTSTLRARRMSRASAANSSAIDAAFNSL
jgi:hypothetical protein